MGIEDSYSGPNPSKRPRQSRLLSYADHSGTIASAGVAQIAVAANPARNEILISNPSPTFDLFYNETGAAAVEQPGSTRLAPGVQRTIVARTAISIIGDAAGQPYTLKEA